MADDSDSDDPGLAGLSPEFQRMVGGLEGHTASFAKLIEKRSAAAKATTEAAKDDQVYFESYADLAIHADMLGDTPRVEAYRQAIMHHGNEWMKEGEHTVVDVGSGTGLLAVFAARAGAAKVIAIEASRLAHFLPKIVEANALKHKVFVHECRAEDLELEAGQQVDTIVSEWMGYFLLFENMLPSVLSVRDRYLKKGGTMLPSKCSLRCAPLEDCAWRDAKIGFWKDAHGIDMSALMPLAAATFSEQPQHRLVPAEGILAQDQEILNLDLMTCTEQDLKRFEAPLSFHLPAGRRLDGIATWFECEFGEAGWLLSTGPGKPATHWKQTVFWFRQPLEGGGGVTCEGKVVVETHEEFSRGYRVTFDLSTPGRKQRLETFELR